MNVDKVKRQSELRLTADDLRQLYHMGKGREKLLTSHAYLYCLIRALRKDGWKLHIPSISDFCKEWGFTERNFYRAKNRLIKLGIPIREHSESITLWLEPDNDADEEDDDLEDEALLNPLPIVTPKQTDIYDSPTDIHDIQTDIYDSPTDIHDIQTPLEPLPDNASITSTPLSQLITPLSHQQPEREVAIAPPEKKSQLQSLASLLPSVKSPSDAAEILSQGECSAAPVEDSDHYNEAPIISSDHYSRTPSIEPEFLNWVINKAKQLPNPPVFPRKVAIAMIKRSGDDLRAEYEDYLRRLQQSASVAPTASAVVVPEPEPNSIASIFARLTAKWNLTFQQTSMRESVRRELQSHPDWNITINGDRLELAV